MKKIVLLALVFLFVCSTASAATYSKWEWTAGRMWLSSHDSGDCKARTAKISQMMQAEGVVHYICQGRYGLEGHRWIELEDGTIIDAAVPGWKDFYHLESKTVVIPSGQSWTGSAAMLKGTI